MPANITAIDAIMGSGKTSFIIDRFNQAAAASMQGTDTDGLSLADTEKFIYIGMYLDEVERIKTQAPALNFIDPQPVGGRKLNGLNQLIEQGRNIASTHALFRMINRETYETLGETDYTLVIDEALAVVEVYDKLTADDIRTLFRSNMVFTDDKNRLRWNYQDWPKYDGRFSELRSLCDNGNLVMSNDTFLMWEMPTDFLELFKEVIVMTYLFEGSLMAAYLRAAGVPYRVMTLNADKQLVPADQRDERAVKAKLRDLITVIDHAKLNALGTPKRKENNPFSVTWMKTLSKRETGGLDVLKLALSNYFKHVAKSKSEDAMWTTFKDFRTKLAGQGYTKGFVTVNAKATNEYIDRKNLAYMANIFVHPVVYNYLQGNGTTPDQELYALSELVQWVWRSQIRRGDPITLYIPSLRMRTLFLDWLNEGLEAEAEGEERLAA
jgi:hypothetical protein